MEQSRLRKALGVAGCVLALALLATALRNADMGRVRAILGAAGPVLLVGLLPYPVAMAMDTLAGQRLLRALGRPVSFQRLYPVRLSIEAIHLSLPGGAVLADSLNPFLLQRRGGVPLSEAVVSVGARKWLIMRSHTFYIALSGLLGFGLLQSLSETLVHFRGLPWVVLASALVPFVLSSVMASAFVGTSFVGRLHGLLGRLPSRRLKDWLDRRRDSFTATDGHIARLAGSSGAVHGATALFLGAWLMESAETFLLLRLLGIPVGFVAVLAAEAGLSLVRSAALFAPAGLGVQDLGYMAFLRALGIPDAEAAAAAFVLVKRGKELVWIAVGYALFFFLRSSDRSSSGLAVQAT